MSILRKYQDRDVKNIIESWKTIDNILYQLPTGGGKSVVIEHIVLNFKTEKILILAHKRELVFQMKQRLEEKNLKVGVIIGNIEENLDSNIIVASVRTVTGDKRIATILDKNFDKIIIDESHRVRTSSYENVLDQYIIHNPKLKILGVTATPYRKDKKPLNKYFQKLICSDDVRSLQEQGYLAKFKTFYTPVPNIDEEVEESGNDYQLTSLSNYMRKPEMLQFLVDSYKKEGKNRQMIIFCVDKKHAKDIQEIYKKNGYKNIGHIDSDTKLEERDNLLKQFKDNTLQILTCIETLTEGVDLPETGCIQLARPTQSLVLYLQMVGRGARPKADGTECIILDNAGCTLEHKAPDSPKEWSLDPNINPNNPGKKNKIVARRSDGSFTEDESEMEFLELLEMTPEEYALNITGGIEKSEQENINIENQIKKILNDIGNYLVSKDKHKMFFYKELSDNNYYDKYKITLHSKIGKEFHVKYKNEFNYIKFDFYRGYNDYNIKDIKDDNLFLINIGKFIEDISKDKILNELIEKFNQIKNLESSKVNINELKSKIKEFKREQLKLNLERHLLTNNTIKIKEAGGLGSYFRDVWYSTKFDELVFERNKLLSTNNISFKLKGTTSYNAKSVKIDKILDILDNKTII